MAVMKIDEYNSLVSIHKTTNGSGRAGREPEWPEPIKENVR